MPEIFNRAQIEEALQRVDVTTAIEDGFVAYSQSKVVVPPVGELVFEDPPGDVHIKYGYIKNDDYFVIKVASGFYGDVDTGLPPYDGLMLVFSQKTARLECILLDECYLTNVRTAAAGAVVAKYLAPSKVERIGVFGAGVQGRMQVEALLPIVECRDVIVWGMSEEELEAYREAMKGHGLSIETTLTGDEIGSTCNLIVTATPSHTPLLGAEQIREGTHITAMGADTREKNELDPAILGMADLVVADSIEQCRERGEIFHALEAGVLREGDAVELGNVIVDPTLRRTDDSQITVADLTGVAVQDIQISKAVYEVLTGGARGSST
ncbi:MAG: ornithine cyclodeaminase family protein [Acidobacteriota bacterium]|jgi:ornithine cyclodeaminase|nr:ornithine cyclodeaminase family protein [Acidobacteriota bacterium]